MTVATAYTYHRLNTLTLARGRKDGKDIPATAIYVL